MYLIATRSDIMHVVSLIRRFIKCPKKMHLLATKRIFRYMQVTTYNGLMYLTSKKSNLFVFIDSDYVRQPDDKINTFSYVFMIGSGAISWSSRKQLIVTLSITKAKFVATITFVT